jgi:hypothetical protein
MDELTDELENPPNRADWYYHSSHFLGDASIGLEARLIYTGK